MVGKFFDPQVEVLSEVRALEVEKQDPYGKTMSHSVVFHAVGTALEEWRTAKRRGLRQLGLGFRHRRIWR